MRVLILSIALGVAALSEGHDAIRFVHPKRTIVLAGPGGVDIPVQTLIRRHELNRVFRLEWGGEACGGSSTKELDGDAASALQPIEPLKVRVYSGTCTFAAAVFGPGGKLRAIQRLEVRVCGGMESCS